MFHGCHTAGHYDLTWLFHDIELYTDDIKVRLTFEKIEFVWFSSSTMNTRWYGDNIRNKCQTYWKVTITCSPQWLFSWRLNVTSCTSFRLRLRRSPHLRDYSSGCTVNVSAWHNSSTLSVALIYSRIWGVCSPEWQWYPRH